MTQPAGGAAPTLSQSPRFTGCTTRNLAEIAAKVIGEFPPEDDNGDYEDYYYDTDVFHEFEFDDLLLQKSDVGREEATPGDQSEAEEDGDDGDREFEFQFPVPQSEENSSPISAGQIFCDGQIKPLFPVFNTDLAFDGENRSISPRSRRPSPSLSLGKEENSNSCSEEIVPIQIPLWKLLLSDREPSLTASASCSSSEADDLEAVYPGAYRVCTPPKEEMSKKSKSTGSSKRWKFKNLVRRSRSDGRDNFVFWIPKQRQQQPAKEKSGDGETTSSTARKARRENYQKKSATGGSDEKKKSSDLVRFFANASGVSSTNQPPF